MDLRRTVSDGLYLGHFKKIEDAREWLDEQVRRYTFAPNPKKMTIRRICREAKEEGINLYPNSFSKELQRRGVEVRGSSRPRKRSTTTHTFSINKDVLEQLEEYPSGVRSSMADLGLRIVMGFPTEDVIVFLPEEEGETTMFFHKKSKKRIQLYLSGDLDVKFEQQIRRVLERSEKEGMQAVVRYAEESGFNYYGGTGA